VEEMDLIPDYSSIVGRGVSRCLHRRRRLKVFGGFFQKFS